MRSHFGSNFILSVLVFCLNFNVALHANQDLSQSNSISLEKRIEAALQNEILSVEFINKRNFSENISLAYELIGIELQEETGKIKLSLDTDKIKIEEALGTRLVSKDLLTPELIAKINYKLYGELNKLSYSSDKLISSKASYRSEVNNITKLSPDIFHTKNPSGWSPLDLIGKRFKQSGIDILLDYSFGKNEEILIHDFKLKISTEYFKQPGLYLESQKVHTEYFDKNNIRAIASLENTLEIRLDTGVVQFDIKTGYFNILALNENFKQSIKSTKQKLMGVNSYIQQKALNTSQEKSFCRYSFSAK